jgi:DNA-binding HxlR family transcriptional regulator
MKKVSFAAMSCSLARSLDAIGDWWTPLILRDVFLGVCRFDDIAEDLGISRNLLAARLKHLVAHGILERRQYQARPARHDYALTQAGAELVPVLIALTAWGDRWVRPPEGQPMRFVDAASGRPLLPELRSADTGAPIRAETVAVVGGPGGRMRPGTMVVARRLAARSR